MPVVTWEPAPVEVGLSMWPLRLGVPDGSGWGIWGADGHSGLVEGPLTQVTGMALRDGRGQTPTLTIDIDKRAKIGDDYTADLIGLIAGEVQVAYDNMVLHWGPVTGRSTTSASASLDPVSMPNEYRSQPA